MTSSSVIYYENFVGSASYKVNYFKYLSFKLVLGYSHKGHSFLRDSESKTILDKNFYFSFNTSALKQYIDVTRNYSKPQLYYF